MVQEHHHSKTEKSAKLASLILVTVTVQVGMNDIHWGLGLRTLTQNKI